MIKITLYYLFELFFSIQDAGHQFCIKGERKTFAGTIAFISGDNLGSQLVGGFKEGPGAFLKCRHCMGNENEIKIMVSKHVCILCLIFINPD